MPFLIRIIVQGAFVFITALLSFVGVTPDVSIPTEEESRAATEERKEIIRDLLEDQYSRPQATDPTEIAIDASKRPVTSTPAPGKTEIPELPHILLETPLFPVAPIKPEVVPQSQAPAPKETAPVQKSSEAEQMPSSSIGNIVVNIVCTQREGNRIDVATGSGVIVSDGGAVLTNAHVAQLFLLKDYSRPNYMECSIHRENIPTIGYTAEVLYISKDWVEDNAHLIKNPAPRGTGENDYALLAITGSTNPALTPPTSFAHATIETRGGSLDTGDTVTVAGYPGVQFNPFDVNSAARIATDQPRITDIYTFARTTVDLFSTTETPVAERGSSGGGVFKNNKLVGIIATTSAGGTHNIINAISLSYISQDMRAESGLSFSSLISGNVQSKAALFMEESGQDLFDLLTRYL